MSETLKLVTQLKFVESSDEFIVVDFVFNSQLDYTTTKLFLFRLNSFGFELKSSLYQKAEVYLAK